MDKTNAYLKENKDKQKVENKLMNNMIDTNYL
jgi:hypothetical protein